MPAPHHPECGCTQCFAHRVYGEYQAKRARAAEASFVAQIDEVENIPVSVMVDTTVAEMDRQVADSILRNAQDHVREFMAHTTLDAVQARASLAAYDLLTEGRINL